MGLRKHRDDRGEPLQEAHCDYCDHVEDVRAVIGTKLTDGAGQAKRKLQKNGWHIVGKRLKCPTCVAAAHTIQEPSTTENEMPKDAIPLREAITPFVIVLTDPDAETDPVTDAVHSMEELVTRATEALEAGYEVALYRTVPIPFDVKRTITVELGEGA